MTGFVTNYLANLGSMVLGREPARPLLFSWYATHRCELACRYCSDGDGKRFKEDPMPELDTAQARRLLSILAGAADTIDITGGEPLLREDLEEILAHARAVGLRTVLNTKGIGIEGRPDLLRFTDILVLSLDTLDPGALALLIGRSRGTAEEILRALRFVLEARRKTGTKVILSAVATATNLDEVSRVLQFALENSLAFQVSPQIDGTRACPALRGNKGYRALIEKVLSMKRRRRGVLGVFPYLRGIRDFTPFRCRPLLMPVIRPDGRMYYPCLEKKRAEVNLLESGSYREALRDARLRSGEIPRCGDCCHIFCHMALSLLQGHPLAALGELRHWRN